jgi:23S rRNA (uracil1939-C5)-methyltransferase
MVYGPHAVARHDGKVLFVRGAAPHECVEAVVREDHGRFAFADLVAVVEPSPVRRHPPCEYLPGCGGCPWQHLDIEAQRAAKQRIVVEQLRRIAGLDVRVAPLLASPKEFAYRRRIKLRVAGGAVGYHAAASHALVPVAHCLLAEESVDAAIAALPALVQAVRSRMRRLEIIGGAVAGEVVVVGEIEGSLATADDGRAAAWLAAHPAVGGLALRGRRWSRAWGDVRVTLGPSVGDSLYTRAPGFTQVNAGGNAVLIDTVVRLLDPQPGWRVLDLYAGAGNFSLPLRRCGVAVTAVERDPRAAQDARDNAAREVGSPLRVIAGRAEEAVMDLVRAGERFDAVVLDPPRSGASSCLDGLSRLAAPTLIYVSCDPATLARDLGRLAPAYRVEVVQPIDLFPHTYHVETVVRATRACEPSPPGVISSPRQSSAPSARRRQGQPAS